MGYRCTQVIEKYDAADLRKRARQGRLKLGENEFGIWAPGLNAKMAGIDPAEITVRHGGLYLPGEALDPKNLILPESIERFLEESAAPVDVLETEGNLLITAGVTRLWNLFTGLGGTAFNAANSRIGVGDGTTAATAADTDIQSGTTNKYWQIADAVAQVTTNQWKLTSTFPTGQANYSWGNWAVDNGTTSGTTVTAPMLNHAVPGGTLGTKTSAAAWAFSITISLT